MANTKISALTALGAAPATNDLLVLVDVSDTSMAGTGTDKSMTVANLFSSPTITTPTFTTSAVSPLLIGGSGATQTVTYKTTTGVGASGADHIFVVGNNGATEAMRILNSGSVGIGTIAPTQKLDIAASSVSAIVKNLVITNSYGTSGDASSGVGMQFYSNAVVGAEISAIRTASPYTPHALIFSTHNGEVDNLAERMRLTKDSNLKIAGTAVRGTTEGTNHLDIFNGTAPVGTLANGISLYSTAGELRVMDAGGTATLLSSHSLKNGEWIHDSYNVVSHKRLIVQAEKMAKFIDKKFGTNFVKEIYD